MTADGYARKQLCFARRHMPPGPFALYDYALGVSRKSGTYFSDDRRAAWEIGVSPTTALACRKRLERDGWLVRLDKGRRLKRNPRTGTWAPIRYQVLEHEAWARKHPGHCRYPDPALSPVPDSDTGPVPNSDTGDFTPVSDSGVTGTNLQPPPVPDSDTKVRSKKEKKEENTTTQDCEPADAGSVAVVPSSVAPLDHAFSHPQEIQTTLEKFMRLYPPHRLDGNHSKVRRAWQRLNPPPELAQQILDALAAYKEHPMWQKDAGRWIPSALKFLTNELWKTPPAPIHRAAVERIYRHFLEKTGQWPSMNALTPERVLMLSTCYEHVLSVAVRNDPEIAMELMQSAVDSALRYRKSAKGTTTLEQIFGSTENFERWIKKRG